MNENSVRKHTPKSKVGKRLVLFIIVVFLLFIIANIIIAIDVYRIEGQYKPITYSYDNTNQLAGEGSISSVLEVVEDHPSDLIINEQGNYFADFGNTYFGTIRLDFDEAFEEDVDIVLTVGETVTEDGTHVWTRKNGPIDGAGWYISYFETTVTLKAGCNSINIEMPTRPRPTSDLLPADWTGGVFPIRCLELSVPEDVELTPNNISRLSVYAPFVEGVSFFQCNDDTINDVYSLCQNTIKSTTYCGIYVDGFRELTPYEADAYINMLGHFCIQSDSAAVIAKNTLLLLSANHTWPTEYMYQYIFMAHEYYMYTGDKALIEQLYPHLQACLMETLVNSEGLIDTSLQNESMLASIGRDAPIQDLIDWPVCERDGFDVQSGSNGKIHLWDYIKAGYYKYCAFVSDLLDCGYAEIFYTLRASECLVNTLNSSVGSPNAVVNAFYYEALNRMVFLSYEIGEVEDSEYYQKKADQLYDKYNSTFVADNGLVIDSVGSSHSSLHANVIALDFGLVPNDRVPVVLDYIKSKGMACSPYFTQYLLECLCKYGETEYALELMAAHTDRSWWYMKNVTGSMLTTESWKGSIKPNEDWNHPWGATPINILIRYVIGIVPQSPGFGKADFAPSWGDLEYVEATIPIGNDKIELTYTCEDGENSIVIQIPEDVVVDYYLPKETMGSVITCNIDGVEVSDNSICLGSGSHTINYASEA